jgi:hypothetical protein
MDPDLCWGVVNESSHRTSTARHLSLPTSVIPAQAGIHRDDAASRSKWIPSFAGVTWMNHPTDLQLRVISADPTSVIPAQAGIHRDEAASRSKWIQPFAGVHEWNIPPIFNCASSSRSHLRQSGAGLDSDQSFRSMDSGLRRNDGR